MLKLNLDPTFTESVEITVPGKLEPARVKLTYKYMTKDEYKAWNKTLKDKEDIEIMMDILVGWQGFDGEFSRENVDIFINAYPAAAQEITLAYHRLLLGSRAKN